MPPEPHTCPTDRPCPWSTALRAIECFLLFGVFPVLVDLKTQSRLLIPFLVVCAVGIFIYLMTSKDFDRRKLINLAGFKRELPRILITWVLGALSLIAVVWWLDKQPATPEQVTPFGFPQRNPKFWAIICVLYPIFSVYPQELILRTFFFHRYRIVFRTPAMMIFFNGLAFAWVHIMFRNAPAVLLCIPAGFLFAYTYWKSKSTIASGLEHAMFGDWMWTVGLGTYFYGGSLRG
ncbi:MAG: CPBP family intramembrane metalloprotease [Phycisphaeraceae bacterium]|nr:CPBP family intramembrane metalloprotease [Phycisphaerales bacterium]MCB9844088.1 CPBP family intramembrane metalloprotease [Phycisphaeraceae bacterium]